MHAPLRLRCPADTPATPAEAARHLALDVRLPLALDAMPALLAAVPRCPCGRELVVDTRALP